MVLGEIGFDSIELGGTAAVQDDIETFASEFVGEGFSDACLLLAEVRKQGAWSLPSEAPVTKAHDSLPWR